MLKPVFYHIGQRVYGARIAIYAGIEKEERKKKARGCVKHPDIPFHDVINHDVHNKMPDKRP